MKIRLIVGAGALVWMAAVTPGVAADIPAAPVIKAPVRAPGQNWYGFFIGVHGGYGWGRNAVEIAAAPGLLPFGGLPTATLAGDPKGFIGGIQWGSNWQFDRVVLGTESDFSYSDIKSSQTVGAAFGGFAVSASADQRLKWFGTTRVRGGVLISDNVLVYGTGGLATGRGESSFSATATGACVFGVCPAGSGAKDLWGWAAGGGVEVASGPWSAKVEYLHYDLGTLNYSVFVPALATPVLTNSVRFSGDMVRGAISYKFDWTPWELIFGRRG